MTYDDLMDATPRERRIARWLAAGIHLAFVLLLVLGVTWQRQQSAPTVADLWSSLPPLRQEVPPPPAPPKVEPKPEPKPKPPEPKPEPKPPEPKAEPKPPPPKPEPKPAPKPDIALKEKLEKEKKLKEQKELELKKKEEEKRKLAQELERKKEEEKRKQKELDARKVEEEKKREKERLAKEAEEKKLAQERQAIADRLAKEQAAAQQSLLAKYTTLIQNHVRRHIIEPPNLQGNPQVEFVVVLIPGGEVLSVKMIRSSGNPAYDSAAERAILKASPLPLPPDPALFQQFRELKLQIRPN